MSPQNPDEHPILTVSELLQSKLLLEKHLLYALPTPFSPTNPLLWHHILRVASSTCFFERPLTKPTDEDAEEPVRVGFDGIRSIWRVHVRI